MFEYPYDVLKESLSMQQAEKDAVYRERDILLAAFVYFVRDTVLPVSVWITKHPAEDTAWENDWRNIVVVEVNGMQMTWHIHDREMGLFWFLQNGPNRWDGHSTQEKYLRLLDVLDVTSLQAKDLVKPFTTREGASDE